MWCRTVHVKDVCHCEELWGWDCFCGTWTLWAIQHFLVAIEITISHQRGYVLAATANVSKVMSQSSVTLAAEANPTVSSKRTSRSVVTWDQVIKDRTNRFQIIVDVTLAERGELQR